MRRAVPQLPARITAIRFIHHIPTDYRLTRTVLWRDLHFAMVSVISWILFWKHQNDPRSKTKRHERDPLYIRSTKLAFCSFQQSVNVAPMRKNDEHSDDNCS